MSQININKKHLLEQLKALVPFLGDEIADNDNLIELGLDSMHIMQLVNHYRANGRAVTFTQLVETPTLADWQKLLN